MVIGQFWFNSNPELRDHLRKVNEERSAAFYGIWRAVTAPLRGLIEAVRRGRRERKTYVALSRLDNHQLRDIGISRSEIGSIAQTVAAEPLEAGLTLAELRQTRSDVPAGRDAQEMSPARADQRRGRAGSRISVQSVAATPAQQERAAG